MSRLEIEKRFFSELKRNEEARKQEERLRTFMKQQEERLRELSKQMDERIRQMRERHIRERREAFKRHKIVPKSVSLQHKKEIAELKEETVKHIQQNFLSPKKKDGVLPKKYNSMNKEEKIEWEKLRRDSYVIASNEFANGRSLDYAFFDMLKKREAKAEELNKQVEKREELVREIPLEVLERIKKEQDEKQKELQKNKSKKVSKGIELER